MSPDEPGTLPSRSLTLTGLSTSGGAGTIALNVVAGSVPITTATSSRAPGVSRSFASTSSGSVIPPPVAAIIVCLAAPFGFLVGTRGAIGGLAVAIAIAIVYWATTALFESLGSVGQLPPILAGWAPDAIFGFLAVYFFLKMPT